MDYTCSGNKIDNFYTNMLTQMRFLLPSSLVMMLYSHKAYIHVRSLHIAS